MTPEGWVLTFFGTVATLLGIVAVFKGGREDRIDRKRSTEIDRLDGDMKEIRADMAIVKSDSRLVAGVAVRALRYIQTLPGVPSFEISQEEQDALERTRPLVGPSLKV